MTWLEYEPENRSKDASKLLGLVKLPLLSPAVSLSIELNSELHYILNQLTSQNSL